VKSLEWKLRAALDGLCLDEKLVRINEYVRLLFTRRRRCGYVGCLGYANLGDRALYEAIQLIFRHHMTFASHRTDMLARLVSAARRGPAFDLVCLGGGTLMGQTSVYRLESALDAGLPVFSFGTGCHPMQFGLECDPEYGRKFKRQIGILQRLQLVSVRDEASKRTLLEQGLRAEIDVIGDPVLAFALDSRPYAGGRRIGVNVGNDYGAQMWGRWENIVSALRPVLLALLDDGWEITLFPLSADEIPGTVRLARELGPRIKVFRHYLNRAAYIAACSEQDMFIGVKLHSVILAHCALTPAVMLAYQPKCTQYMESVNMQACTLQTNHLSETSILGALDAARSAAADIRARLTERFSFYAARRATFVKKVCEMLLDD